MDDIRQFQDERFKADVDKLVNHAEDTRLRMSKQLDSRKRVSFGVSLLVILCGTTWFLWVLLMGGADMRLAWLALLSVFVVPIGLHYWTRKPLENYRNEFKSGLMPRMAHLLGKLKYSPTGGISRKAIAASKILLPHSAYKAEDAFMGVYKGTKLLISEARLLDDSGKETVFDGVFVLLLTPKNKFKGHTIITCDDALIKRYRDTSWKNLENVAFAPEVSPLYYRAFSDAPDEGAGLADADMMAQLHTLNELFGDTKASVAFYKGNRVFLTIPYDGDMFEPGDIYMPITSKNHALKCKREIEQILSVIDVLNVYDATPPGSLDNAESGNAGEEGAQDEPSDDADGKKPEN